jgi:hypothetical protein
VRRCLARLGRSHASVKGALDTRAQVLAHSTHIRMYSGVRIGHGPIIRQWWQDQDNRQFARLSRFLMNTGEFAERREAVKVSLGVDKLLILRHDESRVLMNAIASAVTRHGTRLLGSFSKLVECSKTISSFQTS